MIEWLNNLHPTVNALVVVLGTTTALLTLAAAARSCWRAGRRLFRRHPKDPKKLERNESMRKRINPLYRDDGQDSGMRLVDKSVPSDDGTYIGPVFRDNMTFHEALALMEKYATKDMILKDPVPRRPKWGTSHWPTDKELRKLDELRKSAMASMTAAQRDEFARAYLNQPGQIVGQPPMQVGKRAAAEKAAAKRTPIHQAYLRAQAKEELIRNPLMVLDEATKKPRRATDKEMRQYAEAKEEAERILQQQAIDRAVTDTRDAELRRSSMKQNIWEEMANIPLTPGKIVRARQCAQCKNPIPPGCEWGHARTYDRFCSQKCASQNENMHEVQSAARRRQTIEKAEAERVARRSHYGDAVSYAAADRMPNAPCKAPPTRCLGPGFQHLVNYDTLRCCSCNKVIDDIEHDNESWKFAK